MDWVERPIAALQPGPYGDGAHLLEALVTHATRPQFVYVHEWTHADLVIWDKCCLIHAATWFDAETMQRPMWRTTVCGNPGAACAAEQKS
jgi:taurine dioxygenase